MKYAFLISGIVEILGGFICYFHPELIYTDAPGYLTRLYGISAFALGILSILLYRHFTEDKIFRLAYMTLMFFHGAVAMMTYGSLSSDIPYQLGAVLTHLALFVIFFIMYMKDLKPDNVPQNN